MIARVFEGEARAARNRRDLAMEAAWTAAALGRSKRMTPLKDLLTPAKRVKPKPAKWQDMYAMAASWAASHGEIRSEGASA